MITKFQPNYFFDIIQSLKTAENDFRKAYEVDKESIISDDDCQRIKGLMNVTINFCDMLDMNFETIDADAPILKLYDVRARITEHPNDFFGKTYLGIYNDFKSLNEAIRLFLRDKAFLYLPSENVRYYDRKDLFGIADKFPEANNEITSAGNCYATGNYTACVFHLMRGVEYGLRVIAKGLKVPFPKTYETKTWGTLIDNIEKEIIGIEKKKRTPKRDKDLLFYNTTATDFKFIKNAWRNEVMHTRSEYDNHQAMSVMIHVKELMQHIAKNK